MEVLETTRMSTRGQVIIPKAIREKSKAKENDLFAVGMLDEETVILKKIDSAKLMQDFRNLRAKIDKNWSNKQINEAISWARRSGYKRTRERSKK